MHLTLLPLLSYALALVASPLSERSGPVSGGVHTSDASAKAERDADVPPVKRLLNRANTVLNALGTFGPNGLLGSIDANGNTVPQTSNGNDPSGDFQSYVSEYSRAFTMLPLQAFNS